MSIGPAMDYVWHVMVREGKRIAVYPSGNAGQGISGEMEKGQPAEVKQLFLAGGTTTSPTSREALPTHRYLIML